ncbi:type IX secretion system periplasmic lipoprotein PorW/SprE [Ilyomonas limi]|nr:tetratricopeptide repeat protein [Ilyomonas limi]
MICWLSQAQKGTTITLKKPGKYENRTLPAEQSDTKKFGPVRHALQNMYTHYNYYFNANALLNDIVARAKAANKDDYTKLLPFYNYSLNTTAQSGSDIDSVIYHCTAGVLLHDLRNDWIDNLYFLLGKAYFYRKNFDSAMNAFQYVNYAWGPKDDGYNLPIGSNATNKGELTIATKEKTDVWHKTAVTPPSRNENFLWMARTSIETGNAGRAGGLLEILRNDPKFPERLQPDLHEALAYLFYNQKRYDSAATHLGEALDNANNQLEKARWEYLMAQMYHLAGNDEEAVKYFNRCADHTPDPIMEVNAYFNSINIGNDSTGATTQQKLDALLRMAKKDKYVLYRDIIYYAAAQVELQLGNNDEAIALLKKSIANNVDNPDQRSKSFLLLADVEYNQRKWMNAHNFYDSTQAAGNLSDSLEMDRLSTRQPAMASIAGYLTAVDKEDSLQQVAAMPEAQRTAYLKKTLRQIRRSQGLKDEDNTPNINPAVQLQTQANLFDNTAASKDWYFNNTALKSSGFGAFRQQWGNRPNVDNWRRQSDITRMAMQQPGSPDGDTDSTDAENGDENGEEAAPAMANSIEDLEAGLPLTPEKLQQSNENIAKAYFHSGEVFQNELQNFPAAIEMYQQMNTVTDSSEYREQSLFNLYYCYNRLGKRASADSALAVLQRDYRNGQWLAKLKNGSIAPSESSEKSPATQQYEKIYNAFIEGNFNEAQKQKEIADSQYGNSYWTPQLLYIESIYYVSQREDSSALKQLQNLQDQFPSSPLVEKAQTMADVIRRRPQIEAYLTKLQIKRNVDTTTSTVLVNTTPVEAPIKQSVEYKKPDSVISKPANKPVAVNLDTVAVKAPEVAKTFSFNAADSQYVALVLDKVAPVYATEARNAFNRYNKQTFYNQTINTSSVKLDDRYNIMLIGPFTDAAAALDYIDKTKPQTAGRILPWLTADKYGFLMISPSNFRLLNENKDLDTYRSVIQKAIPDKF